MLWALKSPAKTVLICRRPFSQFNIRDSLPLNCVFLWL
jgi:hypothetical protein